MCRRSGTVLGGGGDRECLTTSGYREAFLAQQTLDPATTDPDALTVSVEPRMLLLYARFVVGGTIGLRRNCRNQARVFHAIPIRVRLHSARRVCNEQREN